jgi:hypothetical protein
MGGEIEFKTYEQHQGELLRGFVGDALDPADPVFFVDDAVEGMDLAAFEQHYEVRGEHAFPPRMLLKLWLFAAIAGVYNLAPQGDEPPAHASHPAPAVGARAVQLLQDPGGERPFAEIKQRMRFRRFSLRGRLKAEGEWNLVCAAFNLKAIWNARHRRRAPPAHLRIVGAPLARRQLLTARAAKCSAPSGHPPTPVPCRRILGHFPSPGLIRAVRFLPPLPGTS